MKVISSVQTQIFKTVQPALFVFGSILFFLATLSEWLNKGKIMPFIFAIIFVVFAAWLFLKKIYPLADEVIEEDDCLVVRRGAIRESIALRDISTVTFRYWFNPPSLVLQLSKSSRFGKEVRFIPQLRGMWVIFMPNPIAEHLKKKIKSLKMVRK